MQDSLLLLLVASRCVVNDTTFIITMSLLLLRRWTATATSTSSSWTRAGSALASRIMNPVMGSSIDDHHHHHRPWPWTMMNSWWKTPHNIITRAFATKKVRHYHHPNGRFVRQFALLLLSHLLVTSCMFCVYQPTCVFVCVCIYSTRDCFDFPKDFMVVPRIVIRLRFVVYIKVGNMLIEIVNENVVNTKRFGFNAFQLDYDNIRSDIQNSFPW